MSNSSEFRKALAKLPGDQREALILVGASGFSYEEAANLWLRRRHHQIAASIVPARASPR